MADIGPICSILPIWFVSCIDVMTLETMLHARSNGCCELCGSTEKLEAYAVPPRADQHADDCALLCKVCRDQIDNPESTD